MPCLLNMVSLVLPDFKTCPNICLCKAGFECSPKLILTSRYLALQVDLKREKLELTPVFSTTMEHDGHTFGYIRLVSFSQKAAADTQHAIVSLQARLLTLSKAKLSLLHEHACLRAPLTEDG